MSQAADQIDDRDSDVAYSQPASGYHWTEHPSGAAFGGTLKLTRTRNANATITFTGTSIAVHGTISDNLTGATPGSTYSVDGGTPFRYTAAPTSSTQNRVQFYQSGPLSNGQHQLVIVNAIESDFLWLDYFLVTKGASTPPNSDPAPPPPANPNPITDTNTASSAPPSARTTSSTTTPNTPTTTDFRFITTTQSPPPSSTPTDGAGASGVNGSSNQTSEEKAGVPIGTIIGVVAGGVALIIIVLMLLLWRRRRSRAETLSTLPQSQWVPPHLSQSGISPFPPSTLPSTHFPPSPTYQHNAFYQQHMQSGHGDFIYGRSPDLPLAEAAGKRQIMQERALYGASPVSSGTSSGFRHGPQRGSFPGRESQYGSERSTDHGQAYILGTLEESPPAYVGPRSRQGEQNSTYPADTKQ
ncbi:hypothetical protein B0H34DRAFT_721318 [Crassisporium funariophilum]|nr:hypothetical protein B0H34DRAFT_721318 [Crassisporium funariophilum]